jgi:trehalose 6-phosphate synthase/phosphatase
MLVEKPISLSGEIAGQILGRFRSAARRMIFLDYDGTLVPFTLQPTGAPPSKMLIDVLHKLSDDPNTRVIINSGRDRESLFGRFGMINVDLACEHGAWIKEYDKPWKTLVSDRPSQWKNEIRTIIEIYINKVPGSVIEEKDHSIVFHYRNALSSGTHLVEDLYADLHETCTRHDVELFRNDMALEVKNANVNKGIASLRWLDCYQPDFILAVGDDRTDEDMFSVMPSHAITIKVRPGNSVATYALPSHEEVLQLLQALSEQLVSI